MIWLDLALGRTDSLDLEREEHARLFEPQRWAELERCLPSVRRESVAGRLLLSHLLRKRCPDLPLPPRLEYGRVGKPRLRDVPLHFNLSHSEGWAVCALCPAEVGVDIQHNREIWPGIVRRFAPAERAALEQLPEEARNAALCRLWSLKEAWCKCTGEGLTVPLDRVVFTLDPLSINQPEFTVRTPEPPEPGWSLAVCVRAREPLTLRVRVVDL